MKYDEDGRYDFTVNDLIEKLKELQDLGYGNTRICLNGRYGVEGIYPYDINGKKVSFVETLEKHF